MDFASSPWLWDSAIPRPTFERDFARDKELDRGGIGPNITFTRGSQATYFTADGTLRFAPHNAIRNSEAGGASAGVGPTHWITSATANNVTRTIVGSGTEDGLTYLEIRYAGTPAAGGGFTIAFDSSSQVVADAGQTWTNSAFCKLQAGSLTGITAVQIGVDGRSSAGAELSPVQRTMTAFTPTGAALGTQRVSVTRTMAAGAERAFPFILVNYTGGVAMDITLRIAAPQLERNATASDYIPTTGTANFDQPRFDHDPATGASRGLLIEESRQNLFQRSEEFDNAYWTKINTTVTANAVAAPDGTITADAVFETVDNAAHVVFKEIFATDSVCTLSVFAKANGRSKFSLQVGGEQTANFDLTAVTATPVAPTGSPSASIQSVGNGWFRCSATRQSTVNGNAIIVLMDNSGNVEYVGNASLGMYFWGAQAEAGAFPTSYIPTTSAAVTRSADSAVVTPISSFYNASEGTLFAEVREGGSDLQYGAVSLDTNTSDNRIDLRRNANSSAVSMIVTAAGAGQMLESPPLTAAAQTYKFIGAYKTDDVVACVNGGTIAFDTSVTLPTLTHLRIGGLAATSPATGNAFEANGHIRKIAYYPRRLSNTLLQQLTT